MITGAEGGAPAWISYVALGLSIVAFLVSTAWGIWTWRREGELVDVDGDLRWPLFQGMRGGAVRSGAPGGNVTVVVRNRGRSEVKVHKVLVASKGGVHSTFQPAGNSAPQPTVIAARDRARWYIDPKTLGLWTKQQGNPIVIRPLVEFGPGHWKKGRKLRIRVLDDFLPGAGSPYKGSFGYRIRTLRKRGGVGPITGAVGTPTIGVTSAPADGDA